MEYQDLILHKSVCSGCIKAEICIKTDTLIRQLKAN